MVLPDMGGLDLSPIIVIFGLMFLRNLMWEILGPMAAQSY
jgi:YggT family protein